MKMHNAIGAIAAAMMLGVTATALADGDAAAGKQKTVMCQGCHGIPDYKTAFPSVYRVPKLGGQHPGYIAKALQAYKSGERNHPTMRAIAAGQFSFPGRPLLRIGMIGVAWRSMMAVWQRRMS